MASAPAASPTATEPREAPAPLEKLKQKLREALGAREQLAGRLELGLARLRAEHAELEAALAAPEAEGGDAMLEEAKKLRDSVAMEIEEREKALGAMATSAALTSAAEEESKNKAAGKRKREEVLKRMGQHSQTDVSSNDDNEAAVQLADLGLSGSSLNVRGEASEARTLAAGVRIALRYAVLTGQMMPEAMLREAFETYTSKPLDAESYQRVLSTFFDLGLVPSDDNGGMKCSSDASRDQAKRQCGLWSPAMQCLESPSFSLPISVERQNDASIQAKAAVIQAFVETEKQVFVQLQQSMRDGVATCKGTDSMCALITQASFASLVGACEGHAPDSHSFFISLFDRHASEPRKMSYRTFREFAGLFLEKQSFLLCLAEEPGALAPAQFRSGNPSHSTESTAYTKPFSLVHDSISRQLRTRSESGLRAVKRPRKTDPMKTICPYELNGICKDTNCSHLHARDFADNDTQLSPKTDDNYLELSVDRRAFLADFTAMRTKYLGTWPLVLPDPSTSLETVEHPDALTHQSKDRSTHVIGAITSRAEENTAEEGVNDDFIALVEAEQVNESPSQRYYDQDCDQESKLDDITRLQQVVKEHPDDCNAWIELAIRQLDLDFPLSDDVAHVTEQSRVRKELSVLSKAIDDKLRASGGDTIFDTVKLKKCLHVLSRALEVEVNSEHEELWLLYLHMCRVFGDRQLEVESAEKAVQFVPDSRRLWLFYLSGYDFESVAKAVALHGRVVRLLVEESETFPEANLVSTTSRSELLAAVALRLCLSLVVAEAFDVLHQILDLIVWGRGGSKEKNTPVALEWCLTLRSHLSAIEIVAFQLIYAHALVFNRLPPHAEAWVTLVGAHSMELGRFAYTIESFRQDLADSRGGVLPSDLRGKVLAVYEYAHSFVSKEMLGTNKSGGEVVLNNWMILVGELYLQDAEDTVEIEKFFSKQMSAIQALPSSAFTASKLLAYHLESPNRAVELMLDVLSNSADDQFPMALHYCLCASLYLPDLTVGLDVRFAHVMSILASNLGADSGKVKAAIRQIKTHQDPIAKSKELEELLSSLLSIWMDELAASTINLPNIYSAIALCHLMTRLHQPVVGIAGLERILRSSNFWKLDADARNLAWSFRFYLQIVQLEYESKYERSNQWDSVEQPNLTSLYKRYMAEMGENSELHRQRERHICSGEDFRLAVIECLYPRQHLLLTTEVQLELFQLCQVTIANRQKPHFFASFAQDLASDPRFALWFSDLAGGGWEWRAARDSLKRALIVNTATPSHALLVRAVVLGDIKRKRMKAASSVLKFGLSANPFSLAVWRLAVGLEIVLGDPSSIRSKIISEKLGRLGLPLICNMYGDASVVKHNGVLLNTPTEKIAMLSWQSLRLPVVPRSLFLHSEIVHLDLSGNYLVELPCELANLKRLKTLNVAENALLRLPVTLVKLHELETLIVAHNNLSTLPIESWGSLSKLKIVDCRFNMIQTVIGTAMEALPRLEMLELDGNRIPPAELHAIREILRNRCIAVAPAPSPFVEEEASNPATKKDTGGRMGSGELVLVENVTREPSDHIDLTNEGDSDHSFQHSATGTLNAGFVPSAIQSHSVIDLANVLGISDNDNDNGEGELIVMDGDSAAVIEMDGSGSAILPNAPAVDAWGKLAEYMASHTIETRSSVRDKNPKLWQEFVDANVTIHRSLGPCVLCEAPNRQGLHQRFNAVTMCLDCINDLVARLRNSEDTL